MDLLELTDSVNNVDVVDAENAIDSNCARDPENTTDAEDSIDAIDAVGGTQQKDLESISNPPAPCCNNTGQNPDLWCKKSGTVPCEECFLVTVSI